jgi:hypothetical protein
MKPLVFASAVALALVVAPVAATQEPQAQEPPPPVVQAPAPAPAPAPSPDAAPRPVLGPSSSGSGTQSATPRERAPEGARTGSRAPRQSAPPPERRGGSTAQERPAGGSGQEAAPAGTAPTAVQRTRDRQGRPVTGRAVPRTAAPRTPVIVHTYPVYSPFAFGSRYGYGSFGLGYFYYDPWWGHPGYGYVARAHDTGRLRLRVAPKHAEVLVNGYYVGVVDDFNGLFQRLTLDSGPHRIEIRADGYEPLAFEVLIVRGQTITYRGELQPAP